MKSRQTFLYGVAFHITGDERYLEYARAGVAWLRAHAYERDTGSAVTYWSGGKPGPPPDQRTTQDLAYAQVGLAFYYYLTRDPDVLADLIGLEHHIMTRYWESSPGSARRYAAMGARRRRYSRRRAPPGAGLPARPDQRVHAAARAAHRGRASRRRLATRSRPPGAGREGAVLRSRARHVLGHAARAAQARHSPHRLRALDEVAVDALPDRPADRPARAGRLRAPADRSAARARGAAIGLLGVRVSGQRRARSRFAVVDLRRARSGRRDAGRPGAIVGALCRIPGEQLRMLVHPVRRPSKSRRVAGHSGELDRGRRFEAQQPLKHHFTGRTAITRWSTRWSR